MADTATRAAWDAYLFEIQGGVHEAYAAEAPFLSIQSGRDTQGNPGRITRAMDGNRTIFSGSQVRHTIDLALMQGGGWPGETGTWNAPIGENAKKIYDTLKDFVQPFSVTVDVERDSFDHSNANAVTRLTEKAGQACAVQENIALLGDGTGLLATITDGATSLATTITGGNADILVPGTVWDIRTRATGADPGQGLRRKIASIVWTSDAAGTITWDTATTATDGGSGNIVHTSADGIYIPGSFSVPGTTDYLPNGLEEAAAGTGTTFEGLSKTTYAQWRGTDGRNGTTTTAMLTEAMLQAGARYGRRFGTLAWDYGIGDPAAIDGFVQSFYSQRMYMPDTMTLKAVPWSGVVVNGAGTRPFPLIKEPAHKKNGVKLIVRDDIQLYGDQKGPSFLEDDGARFRRFTRALPKEAELLDRMEALYTRCCSIVKFNNLDVAA